MEQASRVFMFSGQGSQYYQMGRELFERHPGFRACMLGLDRMAQDLTGLSVLDSLYDNARAKSDPFESVKLTHPAIFIVEVALAKMLIESNITPDYVLGSSLGAFAAATVAGCLEAEDALRTVVQQAAVIETHCEKGGMVAILSTPKLHELEPLRQTCEIAAFNSPSHFVVAAPRDKLSVVEDYLRRVNVTFQRLPVSYAFHSRWIDQAQRPFEMFLKTLSLKPARIPIVCCKEAGVLTRIHERYLWEVARQPIQLVKTIANLEGHGSYQYIDTGPSGSMATFLKYLLPPESASTAISTLSPFRSDFRCLDAISGGRSYSPPAKLQIDEKPGGRSKQRPQENVFNPSSELG